MRDEERPIFVEIDAGLFYLAIGEKVMVLDSILRSV